MDKTTPSTRERDNRSVINKSLEKAIFLHTANVDTIIKLLYTNEIQIITDALIALNRYAMRSNDNLLELHENGILKALIHITQSPISTQNAQTTENSCALRFTVKLLSMLVQLSDICTVLITNIDLVKQIVLYLTTYTDEILHEYAAVTLSYLTLDTNVAKIVYKPGLLDISWSHTLAGSDLDILNASLQIIYNFLHLDHVIDTLFRYNTFKFDTIYVLFSNEYVQIQENSLKLMLKIVTLANSADLYEYVIDNEFFLSLFQVLDNNSCEKVHKLVLEILNEVLEFEHTVIYFLENEFGPHLLTYAENLPIMKENFELLVKLCDIFTNIANVDQGRHELYLLCVDKFLLALLTAKQAEVINLKACQAIHALVKHPKAVKLFSTDSCVHTLVSHLNSTSPTWTPNRQYVIEALTYIIWAETSVPEYLTTPPLFETLIKILTTKIIPAEIFIKYIYLFQPFILCKRWYYCALKTNLLDSLYTHLNHISDNVKIAVIDVISGFMCEPGPVEWCLKTNCYLKIIDCLKSNNYQLVYVAIEFINQMCKHKKIGYLYIKNNLLPILQTRSKQFSHYPEWQRTIENLYNAHLPSKFNYTGRLDVTDITSQRFYVAKRQLKVLPILEDLLQQMVSPFDIIYTSSTTCKAPPVSVLEDLLSDNENVETMKTAWIDGHQQLALQRKFQKCLYPLATTSECSLNNEHVVDEENVESLQTERSKKRPDSTKSSKKAPLSKEKVFRRYRPLSEQIRIQIARSKIDLKHKSKETSEVPSENAFKEIAPRLLSWVGCLTPDPYLPSYVKEICEKFGSDSFDKDGSTVFSRLESRIEFLAEFVYAHTSGPSKDEGYLTESTQLEHLNRIKYKYGTNLIPIGLVKIGSYLERAMLFKVLADRLQLPATLVRGELGKAWNEVPLLGHVVDSDSETSESESETDNTKYEGPLIYYVVDLMKHPGRLYPLGTAYAENYCTLNEY